MKSKIKFVIISILCITFSVISIIFIICRKSGTEANDIDVGDIDVGDIDVGDIDTGNVDGNIKIEETANNEFTFQNITGIKKLIIQNKVGYIVAEASKDNNLRVGIESSITVYDKQDLEIVKQNIKIKAITTDKDCTLCVVSKESGEDLWKWLDQNIGQYNVSVGLNIKVPGNFDIFSFRINCGSINVTGLNGTLELEDEVGSISVDQCQLENSCSFTTKTGNIKLLLCENLEYDSLIGISTRTGNIEIDPNKNVIEYEKNEDKTIEALINKKYSLKANATTGIIKLVN